MLDRPARRRPLRPFLSISSALLALALLALSTGACRRGRSQPESAGSAAELAQVATRDLDVRAEASGTIEPLKIIEVKSRVAGELQLMAVDTGQEIRAGTLVARVDPRDVKNALEQAVADLEVAKARVATTAAQSRRADDLYAKGVIPAQDRETAELAATNAVADKLKAETNLELARERMGDVEIRAPLSGTVIERGAEQGQIVTSASGNVSGGTTLIKMADLATMRARALVDEVDIGRVHPGQPVEVTVEAYPGRVFRGTVEKIEPQAVVDQNVTMFPVLVELENPERLLKVGMNAEVAIEIAKRRGVIAVANSAVVALKDAVAVGTMLGLDAQKLRRELGNGGQRRASGSAGASTSERSRGRDDRAAGQEAGARSGGAEAAADRGDGDGGGGGAGASAARPGIVFVRGANGPEARKVTLGLSDWDFTEVASGITIGESVYLISVARMQQQQRQFSDRMRQTTGFGASSSGGAGSGRPR